MVKHYTCLSSVCHVVIVPKYSLTELLARLHRLLLVLFTLKLKLCLMHELIMKYMLYSPPELYIWHQALMHGENKV